MQIREEFRRDGLAATFLVEKELFKMYSSAFPKGTRFNIGYPSICEEEERVCLEILEIPRDDIEFCLVGHARKFDLDIMSKLLSKQENASAIIWLPASTQSASRILNCNIDTIWSIAEKCIKYWRKKSSKPIDIALTDVTSKEPGIMNRVQTWVSELLRLGYRDLILCDTKGIGEETFLNSLFRGIESFEWHPHNDNDNAINSVQLALQNGVSGISTSLFNCSERMNMLDPRIFPNIEIDKQKIFDFTKAFGNQFGEIEEIRNKVFGHNTFITGTHYLLWGGNKNPDIIFGATTNKELASKILGKNITSKELRLLKNELLYKRKSIFLEANEFCDLANNILNIQGIIAIPTPIGENRGKFEKQNGSGARCAEPCGLHFQ